MTSRLGLFFVVVVVMTSYPDKSNIKEEGFILAYTSRETQSIHHDGENLAVDREGMVSQQEAGWSHSTHTQENEHAQEVGSTHKASGTTTSSPLPSAKFHLLKIPQDPIGDVSQ